MVVTLIVLEIQRQKWTGGIYPLPVAGIRVTSITSKKYCNLIKYMVLLGNFEKTITWYPSNFGPKTVQQQDTSALMPKCPKHLV